MDFRTYVYEVFELDAFERHCVDMALVRELDETAALELEPLTIGRALAAYGDSMAARDDLVPVCGDSMAARGGLVPVCGGFMPAAQAYAYFDAGHRLMSYFFEANDDGLFILRRLKLSRRMLELLLGNVSGTPAGLGGCLSLQMPEPERFEKLPMEETQERLRRLVQSRDASPIRESSPACQGSLYQPWLVGLYGDHGSGRRFHVRWLYTWLDCPLMLLDFSAFSGDISADKRMAQEVVRECIFYQAGLMICGMEREISGAILQIFFDVLPVIFVSALQNQVGFKGENDFAACRFEAYWIAIKGPDYNAALRLWRTAAMTAGVALAEDVRLDEMTEKYSLTPGDINAVVELAARRAVLAFPGGCGAGVRVCAADLTEACHELLTQDMGKKVIRIIPSYGWEDLVLPQLQKDMLQVACNQVRYKSRVYQRWGFEQKNAYGRGVSLIFSGLPGTGKTMAAQVMASELGMELYKVELAAVVSKYVGETEKNLEEIFEKARAGQVILFFDEADVLFSKRTEIRDSNDKYSNMEAAYMLQKIETYDGITILSTNYIQNFDEAFKRRMKLIVNFPFPDEAQRLEIWRQVFPESMPLALDVDLNYLARQFEFSGSNIKNVALYASFLAAAQDRAVNMQDLVLGVKNECSKIGNNLRPEELGEYYMLFKEAGRNA